MRPFRTVLPVTLAVVACVLGSAAAGAQIVLPESRTLAGRLDAESSGFGDLLLLPPPFGAGPGATRLEGWIEIRFAEPVGSKAAFTLRFDAVGPDSRIDFTGGQSYLVAANQAADNPRPFGDPRLTSGGVLDLVTGEVEDLRVFPALSNDLIARTARLNRTPFEFPGSFPPPDPPPGVPVPPLPPDLVITEAVFHADAAGRLAGFEFHGVTALPPALLPLLGPFLGFAPFSFGPAGEFYFPNPDLCAPDLPPEACPDHPDGVVLGPEALLLPHLDLVAPDLRAVPARWPLPPCAPGAARAGAAVAAVDGALYRAGGLVAGLAVRRLDVYRPDLGAWSEGAPLPRPVTDAAGGALDGALYVAGGRRFALGPATTAVHRFDPTAGTWHAVADLRRPVTDAAAATALGRLFVLGGRTPWLTPSDAVQAYDPDADRWRLVARLPVARSSAAAVAVGSEIHLLGGLGPGGEPIAEVEIFDPATATFRSGPSLPEGVWQAVAGVAGDRLVVAGGRHAILGAPSAEVYILELAAGTWRRGRELPLAVAGAGAAVLDQELVLVGGRGRTGVGGVLGLGTRAVLAFDPARGWDACSTQPLFDAGGVLDAASLGVGPGGLARGSLGVLEGLNLAGAEALAAADAPLPLELGGVRLFIDGAPAPLLAVAPERVDFQVPWHAGPGPVWLWLYRSDAPQQAPPVRARVDEVAPALFVQSCGETREPLYLEGAAAVACRGDATLVYAANPVAPGTRLVLQAGGLGPVHPAVADGERAGDEPPAAVLVPEVRIDGLPATVTSVHLAPGEAGIYDVEVEVPLASRAAHRVTVELELAGRRSNPAVIAVGDTSSADPVPCLRPFAPLIATCRQLPPS